MRVRPFLSYAEVVAQQHQWGTVAPVPSNDRVNQLPPRPGLVLHCDLDSFFASVEQVSRPELYGKPVAVSAARGQFVITAASYEAKRHGVRVGVPLKEARALCPGLRFVPARMEAYQRAGSHVHDIIRSLGAPIETLGIDECFLDTALVNDLHFNEQVDDDAGDPYARARRIAEWIKAEVKRQTGMNITVGGGTNKTVAKLASDSAKPDGLLIVAADDELRFLHDTPLKDINGVGPRSYNKLASMGLRTVGDVAGYPKDRLVSILGKRQGHVVHEIAHNSFDEGVVANPKPRTTSSTRSFGSRGHNAREALEDLLGEVLGRLERSGRSARYVVVFAADATTGYSGKRDLRAPTADRRELAAVARELIRRIPAHLHASIAGVTLDGLSDNEQLKLDLQLPWMTDPELSEPVAQPSYDAAELLRRAAYRGLAVSHPVFGAGIVQSITDQELVVDFAGRARVLAYWAPLSY